MTAQQMWERFTMETGIPAEYEAWVKHAYREGEGDRSFTYWREVHREAFAPDYAAGLEFDEHGLIVLEEFNIVYR